MERTVVDNRYVLSGLLGGGGMGKVYLACDEVLDRDVALKVLREQHAESEEFVERFEREAKAAASLNHPNIVQVYDRGRTEDGYYIAMEHVPGGTLKDRILREGPLEAGETTRLALRIADALGVAHGRGIVHRDVKPQNVLLTTTGDAKVADFGIARAASGAPISNSGLVLGTAKYMSPEQAMGEAVGPESDMYSLGVVLYEMLTGELPFEADSAVGVAMKHVNEPPRPLKEKNPAVPVALDAVVTKLLQKKPEDRYPGAAELVADLSRVDEGLSPVFAAPAALPPTSGAETTEVLAAPAAPVRGRAFSLSKRGRRRALFMLGAAALVALLGLAGLGLSREPGGQVLGSLGGVAEDAQRAFGLGEGKVPEVVGLTEEEARGRLDEEGFGVSVKHRQSSPEDEGKVLEQSVPAGKEARRGSRIALAVGDGPRAVTAPELVGLTPEKAEDELERAGLKLGGRKEVPSNEVPEGEVAAQDPEAGKETEANSEVDLRISSGPPKAGEPDRVEVPTVSGLGVGEATTVLDEAGCVVAGTRAEPSPEPLGTVVGTDPPIGTAVASGTPVIIVVSGGQDAPPAAGPSEDAQPVPSSSASATASPGASASPQPPSEPAPAASPPDAASGPSSPEPAPSKRATPATAPPAVPPSEPEQSASAPAPSSPSAPAAASPSSPASAPAAASPPPEGEDIEDEDAEGSD